MNTHPNLYQIGFRSKQGVTVGSRWYGREIEEADRYTLTKQHIPSSTFSGAFHYFLYKRKINSINRFSPFYIQKSDGKIIMPSRYRSCPLGCFSSPRQETIFCPECGFPMTEKTILTQCEFNNGLLTFFEGSSNRIVIDLNMLSVSSISTRNPIDEETHISKITTEAGEDRGFLHHSEYLISKWLGFAYGAVDDFPQLIQWFTELESIGKNKSRGYGKLDTSETIPVTSFKSSKMAYIASPIPVCEPPPNSKPKLKINLKVPEYAVEKRFSHKAPNMPLTLNLIAGGLLLKGEFPSELPLYLTLWNNGQLQLFDYEIAAGETTSLTGADLGGTTHYSMKDLWILGYGMLIPVEVKTL
jgi:hypothetical protein